MLEKRWVDLTSSRLRIVKEGKALDQESFATDANLARSGTRSFVSPAKINELCRGGASIVLSGIRDYSPRLWELALDLERRFRCPVSVNAYYTPPGNQAFRIHYDPYDVFILQIGGKKLWRLFGLRKPSPLLEEKGDFDAAPEVPEEEILLEEDQVLYVPRGHWHAASTSPESGSFHLTVGVRSFTYHDLVRSLVQKLKATDLAREALPVCRSESGHASFDESRIRASLEELWRNAGTLAPESLEALMNELGRVEGGFAIEKTW